MLTQSGLGVIYTEYYSHYLTLDSIEITKRYEWTIATSDGQVRQNFFLFYYI